MWSETSELLEFSFRAAFLIVSCRVVLYPFATSHGVASCCLVLLRRFFYCVVSCCVALSSVRSKPFSITSFGVVVLFCATSDGLVLNCVVLHVFACVGVC